MSGEKRQGKEEIKENLKMRLRKFWGTGSFHTLLERTRIWKGLEKHICNLQDTVILQWNPHIIVYKWPNQKRRASNGRFHLSIQPQEAPAMLAFHPHVSTREHTVETNFLFYCTFLTSILTAHSPQFHRNDFLQNNLSKTPWVESQIKSISHLPLPLAPIAKPFKISTE